LKIELINNTTMSRNSSGIKIVEMNNTDIERSPIVNTILKIFTPIEKGNPVSISIKPIPVNEKKIINDDAALIPLSDISKHFNN